MALDAETRMGKELEQLEHDLTAAKETAIEQDARKAEKYQELEAMLTTVKQATNDIRPRDDS